MSQLKSHQKQLRTVTDKNEWESLKGVSGCRSDMDFISELLRTYKVAQELTRIHSDLGVAIGIAITKLCSPETIVKNSEVKNTENIHESREVVNEKYDECDREPESSHQIEDDDDGENYDVSSF